MQALVGLAIMLALNTTGSPARSEDDRAVELHAFDGSAVIKGDLVDVGDGAYLLQTALGALRIGLDEAECKGAGCPTLDRFDTDFAVRATTEETTSLLSGLLPAYAEYLGADHSTTDGGDGGLAFEILDDESGQRMLAIDLPGPKVDVAAEATNELRLVVREGLSRNTEDQDRLLLALNGAALIAHPESSIDVLNRRLAAELFACAATAPRFFRDSPPKLYVSNLRSESFQTFKATVLDPFGLTLCDNVIVLSSEDEVAEAVSRDTDAIGVVDLDRTYDAKSLAVAECGVTHLPSFLNVKAGEYPLVRRILLEAPPFDQSSGAAQRFIDFAQSDAGQERIEALGWIGLNLEADEVSAAEYMTTRLEAATKLVRQAQPLYQFLEATAGAMRLSTTFRFASGAGTVGGQGGLDQRAQRDISRLVGYLQANKLSGSELLVLGFADASGDYDANLALSKRRAQAVADQLASFGVPITAVAGFGEELPIACNQDPDGRAKNRRVEVWMRKAAS